MNDLQSGVPEFLLQDECLHTSAIPGDDALLFCGIRLRRRRMQLKDRLLLYPQIAQVLSSMLSV